MLKSKQSFKSETHNIFTEKVKRITLSSIDSKRLQTFAWIASNSNGHKLWKNVQNVIVKISKD